MRSRDVEEMFSSLRGKLVEIAKRIRDSEIVPDESPVTRICKKEAQERFVLYLAGALNYDFTRGRLDVSAHPFTTGTRRDVRITTRYDEKDLRGSVFGTIHETGHALYEQGFAEENYLTPLAEAVSLGVHESQSRFWENIIGRSKPFWRHFLPDLKRHCPAMKGVKLEEFHKAINVVKPSFIRTEADEVTYNLHILIRFEMETGIMDGKIGVDEIPALWNEKYEKYLGITPPTNALGCLQDIHWSMGLLGYFPTYTLGNLYAAQIHSAMSKDLPEFDRLVGTGQFSPILNWLRERIHRKGKLYPPRELIEKATGSAPSEEYFVDYLKGKFSEIYSVQL
jgi:carboxypeptidase Taq